MTQPLSRDIEISLNALVRESEVWREVAGKLNHAASYVEEVQDIEAPLMGIFAPAYWAYHATCLAVARVGRSGAEETQRIGELLKDIANVYRREEQINADTAQSIHQQYGKW